MTSALSDCIRDGVITKDAGSLIITRIVDNTYAYRIKQMIETMQAKKTTIVENAKYSLRS